MNDKTIQNARILIVDDTVANLALLQNMLGRVGYGCIKAITDPQETFAALEEFQPDLIILDLMMPRMDGYQVMEILKTIVPKEDHLPILVLTADTNPQSKRRALIAGATDFCQKPFDSSELFLRLHNLLARRFLQRELQQHNARLEEMVATRTGQLAERSQELEKTLVELKATQRHMMQQERLRAFGEMAGGVAHDFNNTLMSIIGYTDLLLADTSMMDDRELLTEYLRTINTAGRDASHVVGRLREFYRPREEGDVFTPIELNKLVEQIVRITQPKWKDQALAAGCSIQVQLDLAKVPRIMGNEAELREVLTNLIFNAVDAMPQGGAITLYSETRGEDAVLEVRDTGMGMTEEVRARCIEPFFTTKGENGTGLGLAQVFGIIRRHDGAIEIESEVGKGTTMRLRFPGQEGVEAEQAAAPAAMVRMLSVLVVDDEQVARDVVTKYLESDGHTVTTAGGGGEALQKFMTGAFDLLVTDQAMPGMTGDQLASVVSKLANPRPVIMMTGFGAPSAAEVEASAVSTVLSKPVSHSALRAALVKAVA